MLPDETTYRFVAILNKKYHSGKILNALGHMTAGLAAIRVEKQAMCFLDYADQDGGQHPAISHFPFIVLQADNGNQIRKVRVEAQQRQLPFTDFTSTMTIGISVEQQEKTAQTPEADLDYIGICLFGPTHVLKEFTGKFSLFRD